MRNQSHCWGSLCICQSKTSRIVLKLVGLPLSMGCSPKGSCYALDLSLMTDVLINNVVIFHCLLFNVITASRSFLGMRVSVFCNVVCSFAMSSYSFVAGHPNRTERLSVQSARSHCWKNLVRNCARDRLAAWGRPKILRLLSWEKTENCLKFQIPNQLFISKFHTLISPWIFILSRRNLTCAEDYPWTLNCLILSFQLIIFFCYAIWKLPGQILLTFLGILRI